MLVIYTFFQTTTALKHDVKAGGILGLLKSLKAIYEKFEGKVAQITMERESTAGGSTWTRKTNEVENRVPKNWEKDAISEGEFLVFDEIPVHFIFLLNDQERSIDFKNTSDKKSRGSRISIKRGDKKDGWRQWEKNWKDGDWVEEAAVATLDKILYGKSLIKYGVDEAAYFFHWESTQKLGYGIKEPEDEALANIQEIKPENIKHSYGEERALEFSKFTKNMFDVVSEEGWEGVVDPKLQLTELTVKARQELENRLVRCFQIKDKDDEEEEKEREVNKIVLSEGACKD